MKRHLGTISTEMVLRAWRWGESSWLWGGKNRTNTGSWSLQHREGEDSAEKTGQGGGGRPLREEENGTKEETVVNQVTCCQDVKEDEDLATWKPSGPLLSPSPSSTPTIFLLPDLQVSWGLNSRHRHFSLSPSWWLRR